MRSPSESVGRRTAAAIAAPPGWCNDGSRWVSALDDDDAIAPHRWNSASNRIGELPTGTAVERVWTGSIRHVTIVRFRENRRNAPPTPTHTPLCRLVRKMTGEPGLVRFARTLTKAVGRKLSTWKKSNKSLGWRSGKSTQKEGKS